MKKSEVDEWSDRDKGKGESGGGREMEADIDGHVTSKE